MKSYNIVYEVECVSVQWVGTCWLMGGCALYHCSRSGVDKCVCGGHKSLIPSASVSYVLQYIKTFELFVFVHSFALVDYISCVFIAPLTAQNLNIVFQNWS